MEKRSPQNNSGAGNTCCSRHLHEDRRSNPTAVLSLSHLEDYKVGMEKSAVTLWDLRRRTSPFSKKYVPGCTARLLRTEAKRGRWLFRVTCSKPDSKKEGHIVRIRILKGKGRKMVTRDVQVSCSCGAWKYWGADFNAAGGEYLEGPPRSDGSAPDIRDPGRTYLICKHVYTVGFIVREWAVPYEFEGEVKYRYKKRPEKKVVEEEEEEVEPGVPAPKRRPEEMEEGEGVEPEVTEPSAPKKAPVPTRKPQKPLKKAPLKETPEEGQPPEEAETPDEATEEEEDFPLYLL